MCYDLSQIAQRAYIAAIRDNASPDVIEHYRKEYEKYKSDIVDYYHTSGFQHPKLLTFNKKGLNLSIWGLIPHWVKDEQTAQEIWNKTINARGESIFEKPSFRDAAKTRCIIPVDGFYEHHHKNGKTYPYYIETATHDPLLLGGIQATWLNKETGEIINSISVVTTKGNSLLSDIHNNPKLKEPRMPLIIERNEIDNWIGEDDQVAMKLIHPNTTTKLVAHTVQKLRGKDAIGNVKEARDDFSYPELSAPPELF